MWRDGGEGRSGVGGGVVVLRSGSGEGVVVLRGGGGLTVGVGREPIQRLVCHQGRSTLLFGSE